MHAPGRQHGVQFDVGTDQAPQQLAEIGDQFVDVGRCQLHDLASAEGEQLPRQFGGLVRRFADRASRGTDFVGCEHLILEQRRLSLDHRQQVVEVVRDTTGELADGFHLLRLPQLRLEAGALGLALAALREIAQEGAVGQPGRRGHRHERQFERQRAAVTMLTDHLRTAPRAETAG